MSQVCSKCGGTIIPGIATAIGLLGGAVDTHHESRLVFVQKGVPTSANPIKAISQGIVGVSSDKAYRLNASRCSSCGAVEFHADEEVRI